jgi:hypothetical protein
MFKKTPEWFLMFFLSGAKVRQLMGKGEFMRGFCIKVRLILNWEILKLRFISKISQFQNSKICITA